jgi:hypothetical protein
MLGSKVDREKLLQRISMLAMLDPIRDDPRRYSPNASSGPEFNLTIQQEAEFVDNLAFIAYRRRSSQEVTALCMEQDEDQNGILIRMAVNGDRISYIEDGLREICSSLEQIACDGKFE